MAASNSTLDHNPGNNLSSHADLRHDRDPSLVSSSSASKLQAWFEGLGPAVEGEGFYQPVLPSALVSTFPLRTQHRGVCVVCTHMCAYAHACVHVCLWVCLCLCMHT